MSIMSHMPDHRDELVATPRSLAALLEEDSGSLNVSVLEGLDRRSTHRSERTRSIDTTVLAASLPLQLSAAPMASPRLCLTLETRAETWWHP